MFEKMGSTKYVLPVLVVVIVALGMSVLFYPLLRMSPKDLPFAVLSLDDGATTPQGTVNAGAVLAQQLVNAAGAGTAGPIKWYPVLTAGELAAAVERNEYYGALTIPADFTQAQAAAQAGEGGLPRVEVMLDNARSPLMTTQLQPVMAAMFGQLGIAADVRVVHAGTASSASASPIAGMMSQQVGITPLVIMSLLGALLLTRIFPKAGAQARGQRFRVFADQLAYAVGLSLVAALASVWLLNGLVGAGAPFLTTTVFLWFASFCILSLFLGAFDLAVPVGGIAVIGVVLCGMMTAVLTPEVVPQFWALWIFPWVPQPAIATGLRDILFMGAGLMPRGSGGLLTLGLVGLALMFAAGFVPGRSRRA